MAYTRAHGMVNQWDMLTGTDAQLKAVWKAYHIADIVADGDVDHTPALYVISRQGRLEKLYITQMAYDSVGQSAQVIAQEVSSLLPSHPKLASQLSLAAIAPYGPGQAITVPSATGHGTVSMGGGVSHLVVFFTTWLDYVSDLKGELITLNSYVTYASAHHLPQLAAVDEATTEPSDAEVAAYLKSTGTLDYPVALDKTGRIADGYQVEDQPWLALVNSSGKITWSHDGWVSLPALEKAATTHA
jgi:hypothetical protein